MSIVKGGVEMDQLMPSDIDETFTRNDIDQLYERVVHVVTNAERHFVPKHSKKLYKFWWSKESIW